MANNCGDAVIIGNPLVCLVLPILVYAKAWLLSRC